MGAKAAGEALALLIPEAFQRLPDRLAVCPIGKTTMG
jgi:hypothetical protein